MTLVRPPAEIEWLTAIIGADAALSLIEAHGGTRVYVPAEPSDTSTLANAIGLPAARALAKHRPSEYITVPVCRNWRIRIYRARGMSCAAIARKVGCHEDTVTRALSAAAAPRNQMDLFPSS